MQRTAVLFTTHVLNSKVREHFNKLRAELPTGWDLLLFYDEDHISKRAAQRLNGVAHLQHENQGWRQFKRPGKYFPEKIPGNEDGHILNAIARSKDYDQYWYIEYDVAYSGNWRQFFAEFNTCDADLLAVNITPRELIPAWPNWKSIETPVERTTEPREWIRTHLAISRYSRRLFENLRDVYKDGWAGHAEALIGTLALSLGLRVEDIGGDGPFVRPGNTNRHYRSTPTADSLAPGTFVFRPSMQTVGTEANLLWHPVKLRSRLDWDHNPGPLGLLIKKLAHRR